MRVAVVSGASSGIGRAIALRLLKMGFSVIGISRNDPSEFFKNEHFSHYKADLSEEKDVLECANFLKQKEVFLLINSAGFGRFEPHEELSAKTIMQMVFLNLSAPMLLANATLKSLKKHEGYLININSIEALRASKFAGVYSATKAGLKAFGDSLFEESRKSALSVTNINPDMTQSDFYNTLRFEPSKDSLLAEDIADAIEHILTMRKGAVVSEYTIRSLNFGIIKK
ncbi:MAG: SDR family oxidoreductase [Sulfurimonas sp.]|jgi:short-subunit dehydrogenase|nr:SDR family oxidoreductase [Sulfurimonadaceae bacterium]